ncbi:MAG: hypothetical protein KC766_15365 [Myxococcales bacterium]|nr:hypothetical protein [Myxococcales bacterium]
MNEARDSQANLSTRRWVDIAPDTLSDGGCESGVQRCADAAPEALLEPAVGNDVESWGEPDEITLVSIYDQTGLQMPERTPLVQIVEEPPSAVRSKGDFDDLDGALWSAIELG